MKVKIVSILADPSMQLLLRRLLAREHYEVVSVQQHASVMEVILQQHPHLLLLDDADLCHEIRQQCPRIPAIILSTVDEEQQKVRALDLGADDYITEPFGNEELLARVRAQLRHAHLNAGETSHSQEQEILTSNDGNIVMDVARRLVRVRGQEIRLTPIEFELLRQLMLHTGKVLTHRMLLQNVWGPGYGGEAGYLRVFMRQLRCKVEENPSQPIYLRTEPGVGYVFRTGMPPS